MGGVDTLNSLIALYRTSVRSKKWYHKFIYHFLDMIVANAWLTYRKDTGSKHMQLRIFKANICQALCHQKKGTKRGKPSLLIENEHRCMQKRGPAAPLPVMAVRHDETAHWPIYGKKNRCKMPGCKGITQVMCIKCNVNICFTSKSNCFKDFHLK